MKNRLLRLRARLRSWWARRSRKPGPLLEAEYEALRPRALQESWKLEQTNADGYLFRQITTGLTVVWGGGVESDKNRWVWCLIGRKNRRPTWDEISQVRHRFLPRNARTVMLLPPAGRDSLQTALLMVCLDAPTVPALRGPLGAEHGDR